MKLLDKNNLNYFIFSLIACISIGIAFYAVTEYLIYDDVENRLRAERTDFEDYISRNKGVWYNSCYFVENKIEIKPAQGFIENSEAFSDTILYDKNSLENVPFRQLHFYAKLGDENYHIYLRKSLLESDILLKYLTVTIFSLLSIAFAIMYLLQKRISEKLWSPFYKSLQSIRTFDLTSGKQLKLQNSKISEFNELNHVLEKITSKMSSDYKNLKEFTENASHELQTPLSLINIRVEELIQTKNLSDREIQIIKDIHTASNKVSKLTSSLLLLSKIENGQYRETEFIDFDVLFHKKLEEFDEIFTHHQISVRYGVKQNFTSQINSDLADILLTNLLGNAVKHNFKNGEIIIEVLENGFRISNTGKKLEIDPADIFLRFKKGNHKPDSSGLGLAIVKQICIYHNFFLSYSFDHGLHKFEILKI